MGELGRTLATAVAMALRADRRRTVAILVLQGLVGVVAGLVPYGLKVLTDAAVERDPGLVVAAAVAIGTVTAGYVAANLAGFALGMRLREEVDLAVDRQLIELTTSTATVEHHEHPEHLDRLEQLRTNRNGLSDAFMGVVNGLIVVGQSAVTVVLLVTVHPLLALLPAVAVPSLWIAGRTRRAVEAVEDATAEDLRASLHLFDLATTAGPGKELRVLGLEATLLDRHHALATDVERRRWRVRLRAAVAQTAGWVVFAAGFAAAIALVAGEAAEGRATAGDLVLALSAAAQVNGQVAGMAGTVSALVASTKNVGRYLWLVDHHRAATVREVPAAERAAVPHRLQDGIRFEGVSFRYPGTEVDVLAGVDLHLPAGATVAIVGDNGAGKSTLVKLLARFYDPTTGAVRADGIDLRRFDVEAWRAAMAAGFQDYCRFELLAGEVVGVGDLPRLDDHAAVGLALERAAATDVADGLAAGLATQLGGSVDGGVDLSGGQWQKLALGRAMMRDAPVLVTLDEPTAAIDAETEHALFTRYAAAARRIAAGTGAITVLVSHRFSTVRMAELIVVVDGGRIVEHGTHAELMARPSLYAELYDLQASAYR